MKKRAYFRRFGVNPFRAPEPLPILNPSNFVPKNGFPVVKGLRNLVIKNHFTEERATSIVARHMQFQKVHLSTTNLRPHVFGYKLPVICR